MRLLSILIPLIALTPALVRADCRATSPDHAVAVIELYTSEGCDSCPPADRWLSQLALPRSDGGAVALAFHVDYWDRLGWKDRFASSVFTARQYEAMRRQRTGFVYTPQVLLQGRDFSAWRTTSDMAKTFAAINAGPAKAAIELNAEAIEDKARISVRVRIPSRQDRIRATTAVALVQNGLASDVKAGENAGKHLAHDHVVRQWRVVRSQFDATGEATQDLVLSLPAEPGPLSIVALAENSETGEVLQALSLPWCAGHGTAR